MVGGTAHPSVKAHEWLAGGGGITAKSRKRRKMGSLKREVWEGEKDWTGREKGICRRLSVCKAEQAAGLLGVEVGEGEARLRAEALGIFQGVPRSRGFILTGTGALEASGREAPRSRCAF